MAKKKPKAEEITNPFYGVPFEEAIKLLCAATPALNKATKKKTPKNKQKGNS